MSQQLVWSFIPAPPEWTTRLRLYGVMIAIGVLVALEIARRRWGNRGGNPEDMSFVALWAVPFGLIGARLYHVITDNQLYRGHWLDNPFADPNVPIGPNWYPNSPFAIWHGGLGIPGGIAVGVLVGLLAARHRGMRLSVALDAAIPAIPIAQAIGRWGNYFNQELFGSPTTLPWGLQVDPAKRAGFAQYETFHPTFLYEALWNVGLFGVLVWLDRKRVLRPGRIVYLYVFGYFLGRLWVESLRVDSANTIAGLRVNTWTSLLVMAAMVAVVAIIGLRRRPGDSDEPYRDGHRWDPEHGLEAAGAGAEGDDTDPDADSDPDDAHGEDAGGDGGGAAGGRDGGGRDDGGGADGGAAGIAAGGQWVSGDDDGNAVEDP